MRKFILLLACLICGIKMPVQAKEVVIPVEEPVSGYIWLGDSRFVGMNNHIHMDEEDNNWVVAKVGQGLSWLEDTAQDEIDTIIEDNPQIDEWHIITNLGVNDYHNIGKYIDYYDSMEDVDIILVSVNPVEYSKYIRCGGTCKSIRRGISTFNEKLQETDYTYIDTYTDLQDNGFSTVDGLHYTKSTYEYIYNAILDELE